MAFLSVFLLGLVTGLRSMLGPAAVCWAAHLQILHLEGTSLAFMSYPSVRFIFTALAIGELIADKLPFVPSRKSPGPFIARLATGALTGATVGAAVHSTIGCAVLGAVGAVTGTMGGFVVRKQVAKLFGSDLPAAFTEDLSAFVIIFLCFMGLR